ncbi:hypothetical protein D3C86_1772920 [compost metagenome]
MVVLPMPPLRAIWMPGTRASTSARPVAPLASIVARSITDISASSCCADWGARAAVTTVVSAWLSGRGWACTAAAPNKAASARGTQPECAAPKEG